MTHWHAFFAVCMVRGRESHWCNKPQVRHNVASSLSLQHLPHHRKLFHPPSIFVACTSHGAKRAARLGVSPQGPVAPPPRTDDHEGCPGKRWHVVQCVRVHAHRAHRHSSDHIARPPIEASSSFPPPLTHTTHAHSRARSDIAAVLVGRHVFGG